MRTFWWPRFASGAARIRPIRGTQLSRYVRLHAERLEERLLMTGNAPEDAAAAVASAFDDTHLSDGVTSAAADALAGRFASAAEFEAWLIEAAVEQYGSLFGTKTHFPIFPGHIDYGWGAPFFRVADDIGFNNLLAVPRATAGNIDLDGVSSTNIQVDGVDEADLIETDGEFLYIISGQDLVIVEAGEGESLRVVSRVELEDRPVGMYLAGDRLAIVSSQGGHSYWPNGSGLGMVFRMSDVNYYDARPPKTMVTVLDIADRSAPALVQKTEMDGQLVTSRVVDGQLRLVLNNRFQLPAPIARPVDGEAATTKYEELRVMPPSGLVRGDAMLFDDRWYPYELEEYVYETQDEYLARVQDELLDLVSPEVRSLDLNGEVISESPLFEATDLYRPDSLWQRNITTIATFDLDSDEAGPAATTSVINDGDVQVYATADSIYLFAVDASHLRSPAVDSNHINTPKTDVWKFTFDGDTQGIELAAKGEFEGTMLNQFAADEHDGYLRVVTKSDFWGGVGQSVLVLQQDDDDLNVVGSVGGIAPDESLYSVRFVGERAYFVTFRQVDPLFVVDLSQPNNPRLLGELHIPGYSDYLQPIDENHVLAIGRGADETTGLFEDLQVSIFDVSNAGDPQLVHRYSFGGGRTTATPATGDRWTRGDGDHHAVGYFPTEQIFTLPIFTADAGWWSSDESEPLFEVGEGGLQVFRIDADAGFTPLGIIEHDTLVNRSVQIGDRLFAISSSTVTVHELTDPTVKLGEVSIAADSNELTELTAYERPVVLLQEPFAAPQVELPTDLPLEPGHQMLDETITATLSVAATDAETTMPNQIVDPRVGWALPNLAISRYAQPARFAALSDDSLPPRVDDGLIQLLAAEIASQELSRDELFGDERSSHDWEEADNDDAGQMEASKLLDDDCLDSLVRSVFGVG